jgi:hypothetical protein
MVSLAGIHPIRAISGGLTDVDIAKLGEALAESLDVGLIGLDLVPVLVNTLALLLNVEAEVLQEDNFTVVRLVDDLLDLGANAVGGEGDRLAEELLQLGDDGPQRIFGVGQAIGTAQVGHEDDGLGAIVDGILDRWDGADNPLRVCDVLVGIEGNVEVDLVRSMSTLEAKAAAKLLED